MARKSNTMHAVGLRGATWAKQQHVRRYMRLHITHPFSVPRVEMKVNKCTLAHRLCTDVNIVDEVVASLLLAPKIKPSQVKTLENAPHTNCKNFKWVGYFLWVKGCTFKGQVRRIDLDSTSSRCVLHFETVDQHLRSPLLCERVPGL